MRKIFYYKDELNDDFGQLQFKQTEIKNHKYKKNFIFKFFSSILYFIIAKPLVFIYTKIIFLQSFKNKKILRKEKGGAFFYINHTSAQYDATIPSMFKLFKMNYVIVQKSSVKMPIVGRLVELLGGVPLSSNLEQAKDFYSFIFDTVKDKKTITFYPEAHVWPFYNGVRNYSDASFYFPAKTGNPVYAITNCLKKRKLSHLPRVTTFIDGPFYKKDNLSIKENMAYLKDECLNAMMKRIKENTTYDYYKYIKIEDGESHIEKLKEKEFRRRYPN